MLGVYNYTVVLTYIGMLMGFTGTSLAMSGRTCHNALLCLMVAGFCDMFDGRISTYLLRCGPCRKSGLVFRSTPSVT